MPVQPKISILLSFRDRDLQRVTRCMDSLAAQTSEAFEVVFVDFGSEPTLVSGLRNLLSRYGFVRLLAIPAQGRVWNRSAALNVGLREAQGEYILFGDIDLIYSPNYLATLGALAHPRAQVFGQVVSLPEDFGRWTELGRSTLELPILGKGNRGGVQLVLRSNLTAIGGYDEHYSFWGKEDNDLYLRLEATGIEERWVGEDEAFCYHQWHAPASPKKAGYFPDRWWERQSVYFERNRGRLERPTSQWGRWTESTARPALKGRVTLHQELGPGQFVGAFITQVVAALRELKPGQLLELRSRGPAPAVKSVRWRVAEAVASVLAGRTVRLQVSGQATAETDPAEDLLFVVWELWLQGGIVSDYAILSGAGNEGPTVLLSGPREFEE